MLIFRFAGNLRRHYRNITLNVTTPAQGLRLLIAQNPSFRRDFYRSRLRLRIAGKDIGNDMLPVSLNATPPDGSTVLFVPIIEGAIEGISLGMWIVIGLSAASVAVSAYTLRAMKNMSSANRAESGTLTNNSFSSTENRIGQGYPVALLLGEMMVGSNVISQGIDTSNNQDWDMSIN